MAFDREALLKKLTTALAAKPDHGFCWDNAPAVETSCAIAAADTTGMVTAATAATVTDTAADTADTATVTKTTKADKERTGDEGRQISHRRFFALSGHPRKQKGSTDSRDAGMKNAACKWNLKDLLQRTGWGIIRMLT